MGARPLAYVLVVAALARAAAPTDGWEFLQRGKPSFARTAFTNQIKRTPDDARAHVGLGIAELALGNAETACSILLDAIKSTPDDRDAHLGLARAFLLKARHRIATGRDDDETRFLLLDAESQGERAAELQASDPEAWVVVAEALLEQGKFDRAETAIGEAEKRGLDLARKRRLRGELSYFLVASGAQEGSEEKFGEARDTLLALLHEDPGATDIRLRLGDLCHAYGHWNDALDAWQAALVVEPFDRPTLELLLTYLRAPDLRPKARLVIESVAAAAERIAGGSDPRPAYAIMCVGHCKLLDRDLEGAVLQFKKASKLDPTLEVECSLGMADADYHSQRYDDAAAAFQRAFKSDRDKAKTLVLQLGTGANVSAALQFLARRGMEKGQKDEARDLLSIAVEFEAENARLWNDYAFLCRETGKAQESWNAYAKTIELAPENPRFLNDAALILQDYLKKDLARARTLYERAIAAADKIMADASATQVVREAAADARKDATANLKRLPAK